MKSPQLASLEDCLAETSIAYMVAGALLSDSFAVLALACYILICLDVLKGLVPLACAEAPRISPYIYMASYSTVPMPVAAAAATETSQSEPAAMPAGPFRTKSIDRMMLNTRDTPKAPNSPRTPICFPRHYYKSFTAAAPAKPRQITSTKGIKEPDLLLPKKPPAERELGRSAPALLESSLTPREGSDHDCCMLGSAGFRHPASAIPHGTSSKDSRRGSSLGIKASRGPSVSSSSKFYANVVSRQGGKPAVLII